MRILPTKHVPESETILGVAMTLYKCMGKRPCAVESLWKRVERFENIGSFDRFAAALEVLYATKQIDFEDGKLKKVKAS